MSALLGALVPDADLVHRHLWLIAVMDWIRGDARTAEPCIARIDLLLDALEDGPLSLYTLQFWWRQLVHALDGSMLLADFGFASRNAFLSELIARLQLKWLPASPETVDASELFALALSSPLDARWLTALPDATLERLARLLSAPAQPRYAGHSPRTLTYWQCSLLDAITFCTSQVRAAGFSPEIRLRMGAFDEDVSPFHALSSCLDGVRDAWLAQVGTGTDAATDEAARLFKLQLESCRHFAATVYIHLDQHGISVDLVFRLRQLRERVLRVRTLLDCLLCDPQHKLSARLLSQLVLVGQERASIGTLFKSSASLLAAKVAERSSIAGEHYITRSRAEYRAMLGQAAGGGALTAVTTALKFAVLTIGLASFWFGFWSGVVYAASFVVIQLMHFTLATKQPAMTAPAMAAKLKDLGELAAVEGFVDEVSYLVRSQVAAVLGNVVAVFPLVIALSLALQWVTGAPMIDRVMADHVLHSLTLLGPSLFFAAFTGVLLFASSIFAGWAENWFVLHRLGSALRYNPRITRLLGLDRARRLAQFMGENIAGFASNISLGFMLGLVPAFMAFWGLDMEVRHVTLSTGQLGAVCASMGWAVVHEPIFWWAVACLPLIGVLNVGVSFYLAFRVALQAHSIGAVGRAAIRAAIGRRLLKKPTSFLWPQRSDG